MPVALTPGLVPHDEAETVPPPAELDAGAALEAALSEADGVPLDDDELQPATTPIAMTATAAAGGVRQWKGPFMCSAFSRLTAN